MNAKLAVLLLLSLGAGACSAITSFDRDRIGSGDGGDGPTDDAGDDAGPTQPDASGPDEMDGEPWSPALLDWLASDFVANGYDLSHLVRTIVASKAYQMRAVVRGGKVEAARRQLSLRFGHLSRSKAGVLDAFFLRYEREAEGRKSFIDWVRQDYDEQALGRDFHAGGLTSFINDKVLARE